MLLLVLNQRPNCAVDNALWLSRRARGKEDVHRPVRGELLKFHGRGIVFHGGEKVGVQDGMRDVGNLWRGSTGGNEFGNDDGVLERRELGDEFPELGEGVVGPAVVEDGSVGEEDCGLELCPAVEDGGGTVVRTAG